MEIRCQIIYIKHRFWKNHELETFGTRKRILRKKIAGMWLCQKVWVVFWTFHTFPCIFSPRTIFGNSSRLVRYIDKCMEMSKHDCMLSSQQLQSSVIFCKILCIVPKVSNSWIFQKWCFMKIIWHQSYIQTLLFQDMFAYSSKWRQKPW